MRVPVHTVAAALFLLGACATGAPEPERVPLPLPPPPPPRMQPARPAPAQPAPSDAALQPNGHGAPAEASPQAPMPAEALRHWRVARDGTTGCAAPAPLRLARQGEGVVPRLLAEARAAGGCRNTFRVNQWSLVAQEDDLVQLHLLNGPTLTLWFLRADVIAP